MKYDKVEVRMTEQEKLQLKVDFCKMFMPEIMPKAKPKKPTMKDRIDAL